MLNDAKANFGGGVSVTKTPWQYDGYRVFTNSNNECVYVNSVFAELFAPETPIAQCGSTSFGTLYNGKVLVSPMRIDAAPRKLTAE